MNEERFDVPDDLWEIISPLLPQREKSPKGRRPGLDNRIVFAGILYRLRTGIGWRDLPPMYGAKSSVHKRFQEWVEADVFQKINKKLLLYYNQKKRIRTKRMAADSSYSRAPKGGNILELIQQIAQN
ncbi:MAG: transposase [Spirochaetota bacterium]